MKLQHYLKEVSNTLAYWISPKGEVIEVSTNHIDVVIKNPQKFKLTSEYITGLYDKYGETLGSEGKAREDIIIKLVKSGWIRVRRYRNEGYSLNVSSITKKVKDTIFDWVDKLVTVGILGMREKDPYIPLNIIDVQKGILYESNESFDDSNSVIICESINEVK
jgi:hypothetical protein